MFRTDSDINLMSTRGKRYYCREREKKQHWKYKYYLSKDYKSKIHHHVVIFNWVNKDLLHGTRVVTFLSFTCRVDFTNDSPNSLCHDSSYNPHRNF